MKHVLVIVVLAALTGCGNKPEAVQQIQPQPQVQQRPLISATEEFNLRGKCEDLVQKKYLALGGLVGKALTAEVKSCLLYTSTVMGVSACLLNTVCFAPK